MRVLFVTNEGRGAYAGRTVRWLGIDFTYATFTFEDLVRFRYAPDRGPLLDRRALDRAIDEIERYDGVFAEEGESMLLGYVRQKRRLRPVPWLVNIVQRFRRATQMRDAIRARYGDDPLSWVARDPAFTWLFTTRTHRDELQALGLPASRLHYCPVSTRVQTGLFPDSATALAAGASHPLPPALEPVRGGLLMAGTNNRDLETTAAAAAILEQSVHVLTDLRRVQSVDSPWLVYHDVVPLPQFISAVAHAAVLLLPVVDSRDSCAQQTLAAARCVRTIVVASDVLAVRDYIEDGTSGFLARPGDPRDLADKVLLALAHADDSQILDAAQNRDLEDGGVIEHVFRCAFLGAATHARGSANDAADETARSS